MAIQGKKGIAPIVILVILGVIAASIILAFTVFSSKARFIVIGAGLIAGAVTYATNLAQTEVTRPKIAVLLILLGAGMLMIFGAGFLQQTILSVSTVTVQGDGEKVLIVATPGGENAIVELTKEELNQKIEGDGFTVERGVRIETELVESKEVYTLQKTDSQIVDFVPTNLGNPFGPNPRTRESLMAYCRNNGKAEGLVDAFLATAGRNQVWCVNSRVLGNVGQIDGSAQDRFKVRVAAAGDEEFVTELARGKKVSLADGQIDVTFEGSLKASDEVKQVNYKIFWKDGAFQHLIIEDAVGRQSGARNTYNTCVTSVASDNSGAHLECAAEYNRAIGQILVNRNGDFAPRNVQSLNFDTQTENRGQMVATLIPGTNIIPTLRIEVSGKFLGIEKPKGVPDITQCVSDVTTKAGRTSQLQKSFTLKNIGKGQDIFGIDISCTNPKIGAVVMTDTTLNAGQSRTIPVTVTGESTKVGSIERSKCTITVNARNGEKTDACTFNVALEFATAVCSPNKNQCSADRTKVLQCNSEGDGFNTLQTCSSDQTCGADSAGRVACVSKTISEKIDDVLGDEDKGDSNAGDSTLKAECEEKASKNPFAGYTYVKRTETPGLAQKTITVLTFGAIGDLSSTTSESCEARYVPYYIFGGFAVILIIAIIWLLKPRRKR